MSAQRARVGRVVKPAPNRQPALHGHWWVPIGLAVSCVAVYANSFVTGFPLDNRQLILHDPRVHAWTSQNLSLIVTHTYWWPYGESGLYRPLTTLSYLVNYALLGNAANPLGYHVVNLLLHVANVLLVWAVASRVTRNNWIGTTAAAIWAVVPLSTEAVTNIVGRADLIAAAGALAALLIYVELHDRVDADADDRHRTSMTLRPARYVQLLGVALFIAAGVLAKESALAVLGVIAVYELLWRSRRSAALLMSTTIACALLLIPWALQRAAVLGGSSTAEFAFTDNPIAAAGFWQGRLTAVQVMWRYLVLLAWPARLSNDYSYAQVPLAQGMLTDWIGVLLLAGGAIGLLWQLRHRRALLFFAAFAFLMFLPASNLLFTTGTIMGERLVYLPSAGLAVLLAIGLHEASASTRVRWLGLGAVALIVVAYGARTVARNRDWRDDVTLWRSGVAAAPRSAKAHSGLADALYDADPTHANIDEVIAEADRAAAILDPLPDQQNTFHVYRQAGAFYLDKAARVESSSSSGSVNPDLRRLYARAMNLLDRAVLIARSQADAIPDASQEPEADAQRLRAVALLALDNPAVALIASERARNLSPLNSLAYRTAARALLALHRADEAAVALLTGSIVTSDRSLGDAVLDLYRNGLDPDGCAITGSGAAAALNPRCPIVQRQSCAATVDAVRIETRIGRRDQAEQLRATAIEQLGCRFE